ncbi:MAG: DNA translocase FtsK 4TM domain-containing protein [Candidatus Paceibacterota bacterium]|jgi:S-DNA-T family DNA segregation ATPase FtsK/SpoIIIE
MGRKNKKKHSDGGRGRVPVSSGNTQPRYALAQETIRTIWALVLFAAAIVFSLAGFARAGMIGQFLFDIATQGVGWGYILIPITLAGMSINLLLHENERKIYGATIWGALLFLASSLGFIDVVAHDKAGIIGFAMGYCKQWLGPVAWGVVLVIAAVIGIVIVFNRPIRLFSFGKSDDDEPVKGEALAKNEDAMVRKAEAQSEQTKKEKDDKEPVSDDGAQGAAVIVAQSKSVPAKALKGMLKKFADYKAPPLELLKTSVEKPGAGDLRANANIIKRTLESFGIPVEMGEINIGPKVTRFTLRPAEGIKLSRITALNQDLSLALSAHPIRIEAPIPGRPYVGIEVPNKSAAMVRLGNLISYPDFVSSGTLGFCIGRDVTGEPVFSNIEKMPHLLIAGATGSGKSITLHSALISLLYKNSPATLKLILIDPKRVELSVYNGLPHLVAPVVTQGKKALGVFRWAISEMERRYEIFVKAGARDIQSYNKKNTDEAMSFIVIVVDEMADLMAAYGRDIENAIVRLAQMARATGIHLILSTQRPSVEVITGLIKANITSRVALQVASQIDSRTILDTAGAEKLLGGGDLLFISAELSKPRRIQGAYISEEEIKSVTDFIREHNAEWVDVAQPGMPFESDQSEEGTGAMTSGDIFDGFEQDADDDEMLEQAVDVVREAQKASASLLQRRLKVGYARAARLLDMMEEKNIIGPGDGAKAREVYITREE